MLQPANFSIYVFFLVTFVNSFTPGNVDELLWKPSMVTKSTVLADHTKMTRQSIRNKTTIFAVITPWNPRGYHLVRKTVDRLTHISPHWFTVTPMSQNDKITTAVVTGEENLNMEFVKEMRKRNQDIKIVPIFKFAPVHPTLVADFVVDERGVQKVSQAIANFCHRYGFDGAFIEMFFQLIVSQNESVRWNAVEAMAQMANVLRRNGLETVLALPSPMTYDGKDMYTPFLLLREISTLLDAYDFCQIHSYSDVSIRYTRFDKSTWIRRSVEYMGNAPNLLLGLNYYGVEYKMNEYRNREGSAKHVDGKRYLKALKDDEAMLWYNPETVEHELTLRSNNSLIFFPSMTSLEYRMRLAHELNLGLVVWDYGRGLDYFTNLV